LDILVTVIVIVIVLLLAMVLDGQCRCADRSSDDQCSCSKLLFAHDDQWTSKLGNSVRTKTQIEMVWLQLLVSIDQDHLRAQSAAEEGLEGGFIS
jgi:hypothetical protein